MNVCVPEVALKVYVPVPAVIDIFALKVKLPKIPLIVVLPNVPAYPVKSKLPFNVGKPDIVKVSVPADTLTLLRFPTGEALHDKVLVPVAPLYVKLIVLEFALKVRFV